MTTAPRGGAAGGGTELGPDRSGYEIIILGFSLLAVLILLIEFVVPLEPETTRLIRWVDHTLCALFFADFVRTMATTGDRWGYLKSTGWLDLLSAVPAVEAFRLARVARVIRVIRAMRILMMSNTLGRRLRERPRENALLTAAFVCFALVTVGAVAVLEVERDAGNITDATEALWWAITTITTVGYGDHTPVTALGRVIGVVLMLVGVGAFGLLAGLLASVLVRTEEVEAEAEMLDIERQVSAANRHLIDEVRHLSAEVTALRREVSALRVPDRQ